MGNLSLNAEELKDIEDILNSSTPNLLSSTTSSFPSPFSSLGCSSSSSPSCSSSPSPLEPPLVQFKKKGKLSVTDLSAQLWCETQLNFTLTTGRRRETAAMRAGTARHEILEKADHEIVDVEVDTREEALGLRLLNSTILLQQLYSQGKVRELWVFGIVDGILLRGVIDEVELRTDRRTRQQMTIISDTKTRRQKTEPSLPQKRTSAMQLQVYYFILNELREGHVDYDRLLDFYECSADLEFTVEELQPYRNLATLIPFFKDVVERLPPIRRTMEIVYEYEGEEFARNDIPYHEKPTMYAVHDLLDWWKGLRDMEAVPLSETWKCKYCDFLENCTSTLLEREVIEEVLLKLRLRREDERLQKEKSAVENGNGAEKEAEVVEVRGEQKENDPTLSQMDRSMERNDKNINYEKIDENVNITKTSTSSGQEDSIMYCSSSISSSISSSCSVVPSLLLPLSASAVSSSSSLLSSSSSSTRASQMSRSLQIPLQTSPPSNQQLPPPRQLSSISPPLTSFPHQQMFSIPLHRPGAKKKADSHYGTQQHLPITTVMRMKNLRSAEERATSSSFSSPLNACETFTIGNNSADESKLFIRDEITSSGGRRRTQPLSTSKFTTSCPPSTTAAAAAVNFAVSTSIALQPSTRHNTITDEYNEAEEKTSSVSTRTDVSRVSSRGYRLIEWPKKKTLETFNGKVKEKERAKKPPQIAFENKQPEKSSLSQTLSYSLLSLSSSSSSISSSSLSTVASSSTTGLLQVVRSEDVKGQQVDNKAEFVSLPFRTLRAASYSNLRHVDRQNYSRDVAMLRNSKSSSSLPIPRALPAATKFSSTTSSSSDLTPLGVYSLRSFPSSSSSSSTSSSSSSSSSTSSSSSSSTSSSSSSSSSTSSSSSSSTSSSSTFISSWCSSSSSSGSSSSSFSSSCFPSLSLLTTSFQSKFSSGSPCAASTFAASSSASPFPSSIVSSPVDLPLIKENPRVAKRRREENDYKISKPAKIPHSSSVAETSSSFSSPTVPFYSSSLSLVCDFLTHAASASCLFSASSTNYSFPACSASSRSPCHSLPSSSSSLSSGVASSSDSRKTGKPLQNISLISQRVGDVFSFKQTKKREDRSRKEQIRITDFFKKKPL